jgi:hypothetical protein
MNVKMPLPESPLQMPLGARSSEQRIEGWLKRLNDERWKQAALVR